MSEEEYQKMLDVIHNRTMFVKENSFIFINVEILKYLQSHEWRITRRNYWIIDKMKETKNNEIFHMLIKQTNLPPILKKQIAHEYVLKKRQYNFCETILSPVNFQLNTVKGFLCYQDEVYREIENKIYLTLSTRPHGGLVATLTAQRNALEEKKRTIVESIKAGFLSSTDLQQWQVLQQKLGISEQCYKEFRKLFANSSNVCLENEKRELLMENEKLLGNIPSEKQSELASAIQIATKEIDDEIIKLEEQLKPENLYEQVETNRKTIALQYIEHVFGGFDNINKNLLPKINNHAAFMNEAINSDINLGFDNKLTITIKDNNKVHRSLRIFLLDNNCRNFFWNVLRKKYNITSILRSSEDESKYILSFENLAKTKFENRKSMVEFTSDLEDMINNSEKFSLYDVAYQKVCAQIFPETKRYASKDLKNEIAQYSQLNRDFDVLFKKAHKDLGFKAEMDISFLFYDDKHCSETGETHIDHTFVNFKIYEWKNKLWEKNKILVLNKILMKEIAVKQTKLRHSKTSVDTQRIAGELEQLRAKQQTLITTLQTKESLNYDKYKEKEQRLTKRTEDYFIFSTFRSVMGNDVNDEKRFKKYFKKLKEEKIKSYIKDVYDNKREQFLDIMEYNVYLCDKEVDSIITELDLDVTELKNKNYKNYKLMQSGKRLKLAAYSSQKNKLFTNLDNIYRKIEKDNLKRLAMEKKVLLKDCLSKLQSYPKATSKNALQQDLSAKKEKVVVLLNEINTELAKINDEEIDSSFNKEIRSASCPETSFDKPSSSNTAENVSQKREKPSLLINDNEIDIFKQMRSFSVPTNTTFEEIRMPIFVKKTEPVVSTVEDTSEASSSFKYHKPLVFKF